MRILGVDFEGSEMFYVLLLQENGQQRIGATGRVGLTDERSGDDLKSFHRAIGTVLNDSRPEVIALKKKPHAGMHAAGAPAIKMEALVLLAADCPVKLITPQRLNKIEPPADGLFKYLHDAARAAIAAS